MGAAADPEADMRRIPIGMALVAASAIVVSAAIAGTPKPPPDLSGNWRFDPSRSDAPPAMGGGGHHGGYGGGGGGGGGGWGGHHGGGYHGGGGYGGGSEGGPEGGQARSRPMRLPDLLRIEEQPEYVVLEDSTGADLMQIVIGGGKVAPNPTATVPRVQGEWKKDQLEAKHQDERGFKVTQTYALEDNGRTLEITTKVEGRRSFESKRVYARQTKS